MKRLVRSRLARWGVGLGVVVAAHFAPLSLTREQRERLLLAMAGRDRSEAEWVEDAGYRAGAPTAAGDQWLWVIVLPTLDEVRQRARARAERIDTAVVCRR